MAVELDARAAGALRLKDRVCIVTGAGQGIGRATARRLGQEGGKIVVADRVDASASETISQLRDHGVEATKVLVDLGTFAGAQDLMTQASKAFGRIDVLVNNVGGTICIDGVAFDTKLGLAMTANGRDGTITVVKEISPDKFAVVQTVPTVITARTIAYDPTTGHMLLPSLLPTAEGKPTFGLVVVGPAKDR